MVTENPSDGGSPHKPKKVWKPKPAVEGVPSLFAHAALSKPLKINSAATATVKVKSKEATTTVNSNNNSNSNSNSSNKRDEETHQPTGASTCTHSAPSSLSVPAPARLSKSAATSTSISKVSSKRETTAKAVASANSTTNTNTNSTPITGTTSTKGILEPSKVRSSRTTKQVSDDVKRPAPSPRKPNQSAHVIGGSSTVAGTPRSWPKPHAVSESEKPKHHRASGKGNKDNKDNKDDEQFHKEIDHLIPEMYRKKSAKQLEQEQQEEIQLMRRIMWELQQLELAQQEEALRCKPISMDVDETLNVLKNAKKMNDMLDDHASVEDSDTSSKRKSAYSTHMKSKLAFFNSHHSVSHDSSDSDDSSSISSWHSDESDGLFRG